MVMRMRKPNSFATCGRKKGGKNTNNILTLKNETGI